jgi:hypothetical protein
VGKMDLPRRDSAGRKDYSIGFMREIVVESLFFLLFKKRIPFCFLSLKMGGRKLDWQSPPSRI